MLVPQTNEPVRALRVRLGLLLALYCVGLQLAAVVEQNPWPWPLHPALAWPMSPAELAFAMIRGLPVGYFVGFALRRRGALLHALGAGAAFGVALQLLAIAADRAVRPLVPVGVALGAALGAATFVAVSARLRARAASDAVLLAPDLPLIGGAYVAAPLLWLASTAAVRAGLHEPPWTLLLLALYGASLIGSARASRGPAGGSLPAYIVATAVWSFACVAPFAAAAPARVAAVVAVAALFATLHPIVLGVRARERRMEVPALRRALPLLALYLLLAAIAPLAARFAGAPGRWESWAALAAAVPAAGWTQQLAGIATLGYALADPRAARRRSHGVVARRARVARRRGDPSHRAARIRALPQRRGAARAHAAGRRGGHRARGARGRRLVRAAASPRARPRATGRATRRADYAAGLRTDRRDAVARACDPESRRLTA